MAYTIIKLNNKIRKLEQRIEFYKNLRSELIKDNQPNDIYKQTKRNYFIYTIRCENDCYYVGQTTNVERRFERHKIGKGSWFTRQNKPIEVIDSINIGIMTQSQAMEWENKITAQVIKQYGLDNVRGGAFIQRNSRYFIHKLNEYQEIESSIIEV